MYTRDVNIHKSNKQELSERLTVLENCISSWKKEVKEIQSWTPFSNRNSTIELHYWIEKAQEELEEINDLLQEEIAA